MKGLEDAFRNIREDSCHSFNLDDSVDIGRIQFTNESRTVRIKQRKARSAGLCELFKMLDLKYHQEGTTLAALYLRFPATKKFTLEAKFCTSSEWKQTSEYNISVEADTRKWSMDKDKYWLGRFLRKNQVNTSHVQLSWEQADNLMGSKHAQSVLKALFTNPSVRGLSINLTSPFDPDCFSRSFSNVGHDCKIKSLGLSFPSSCDNYCKDRFMEIILSVQSLEALELDFGSPDEMQAFIQHFPKARQVKFLTISVRNRVDSNAWLKFREMTQRHLSDVLKESKALMAVKFRELYHLMNPGQERDITSTLYRNKMMSITNRDIGTLSVTLVAELLDKQCRCFSYSFQSAFDDLHQRLTEDYTRPVERFCPCSTDPFSTRFRILCHCSPMLWKASRTTGTSRK